MFAIGTIPAGISNCYKQKCLKSVDLEVMYSAQWSGYWQILWGLLMFPLNWIALPDPAARNVPSETGQYISRTFTCFFGSVPAPISGMSEAAQQNDLACASPGGSAFVWFIVYLVFNVSFNVLLLWLTKRMSATWAAIGTVLCMDLTALLSMSPTLMGNEATPVTLEQYLGLLLAGIAMWVYNLQPELNAQGKPVEGADTGTSDAHSVGRTSSNSLQSDWPAALECQGEEHARWSQVSLAGDRATLSSFGEV